MEIIKTTNTVARENTYYLVNNEAILLVDPGSDWETIKRMITDLAKPVAAILLTHAHYDHIMSLDLVREHFDQPPVYIAEAESDWLTDPIKNLSGLPRHADMANIMTQPADYFYQYTEPYLLAGFHFYVRPTPGHSIGGVSLVFDHDNLVLTGDALFCETIGRFDLPTGNHEQLLTSIKKELFTLPSHYQVHPGHGKSTTIAHEKNFNPYFS